MATVLPELKFRHYIEPRMRGEWMMTWHEDREITPGVPDLHYVMIDSQLGKYRVGWIELKATDKNITPSQRIGIEPSQHQYFRRWCSVMPMHFMVRVKDDIFLIPGTYHKELSAAVCLADISVLADLHFKQQDIASVLPPFLRKLTAI